MIGKLFIFAGVGARQGKEHQIIGEVGGTWECVVTNGGWPKRTVNIQKSSFSYPTYDAVAEEESPEARTLSLINMIHKANHKRAAAGLDREEWRQILPYNANTSRAAREMQANDLLEREKRGKEVFWRLTDKYLELKKLIKPRTNAK